jgi:hypothetical protein
MKVKLLQYNALANIDDLVLACLRRLADIEIVDNVDEAVLVICNYHGLKSPSSMLSLHKVPLLRRYVQVKDASLKLRPDQTSLYVSAECPVWSRFLQSDCDFGISHEYLPGFDRHCRVPYWYYSIDWSEFGVANNSSTRLGVPVKPSSLAEPRQFREFSFYDRLAMISSHLNGFKAFFFHDLCKSFDVDLVGGAAHGFVKSKISFLTDYTFSLCPENLLYPGYCTEKVLEAWACSTIPITCLDEHSLLDFNGSALINLFRHIPTGLGSALREVIQDRCRIRCIYESPLFVRPPAIDFLLGFLERVLESASRKSC